MATVTQRRPSTQDTSRSIHAPTKRALPLRPVSNCGFSRAHSPGFSQQSPSAGLSSLQLTLRKLRGDEERHQNLMEDMARRLRLPSRMQDHFSKSFVDSGFVFTKTIGQGHFGLVKLGKRKVVQSVKDVKTSMGLPHTPRKSLPTEERSESAAAQFVAVRIIPRTKVRDQGLRTKELFTKLENYATLKRQVDAMRDLDHPNIVRVHETFEDFQNIYIVMQLCTGGSLLEAREMGSGSPMSERRTAEILVQIFGAIAQTHERGIVHQDLRLENIHYESADADARVIITDWGAVEYLNTPSSKSRRYLAITDYSAPELEPQWRTDRSDIWSIGIMMYAMLTHALPKWPQWPPLADFSWSQEVDGLKASFSLPCQELLESLLRLDYQKRPSAREVVAHPWIVSRHERGEAKTLPLSVGSSLMKFRRANRMEKATAWFAATHLSGQRLHELSEAFNAVDTDRSGTITRAEMEKALRKQLQEARMEYVVSESEVAEELVEDLEEVLSDENKLTGMIAALDADGNGVVSFSNFLSAAMDAALQDNVHLLWEAFKRFDHMDTGRVSIIDLSGLLKSKEVDEVLQRMQGVQDPKTGSQDTVSRRNKKTRTMKDLEEIFSAMGNSPQGEDPVKILEMADTNNDGCITFDEFVAVITDKKIQVDED